MSGDAGTQQTPRRDPSGDWQKEGLSTFIQLDSSQPEAPAPSLLLQDPTSLPPLTQIATQASDFPSSLHSPSSGSLHRLAHRNTCPSSERHQSWRVLVMSLPDYYLFSSLAWPWSEPSGPPPLFQGQTQWLLLCFESLDKSFNVQTL